MSCLKISSAKGSEQDILPLNRTKVINTCCLNLTDRISTKPESITMINLLKNVIKGYFMVFFSTINSEGSIRFKKQL